jgi:Kelch motif protein
MDQRADGKPGANQSRQIGGSVAKCFRISSVLFVVAVWSALPALSTARTQFVAPPKRAHHALVYDGQRQRVLLTGGNVPIAGGESHTSFNDLWAFDGMRWAALPSSGVEVWGMRLAFDSRRRRVVSFGGISNRRAISEVRVLENDVWTALGQHGEMPAAEAGFVYDSRRDRFIAFGGTRGDGQAYGDTWEFAGSTWAKVASQGPRARQGHAMVFDERRGRTVIFGGTGSYGPDQTPPRLGDVWEFDGRRWSAREFANGPGPRTSPGAAYDSKRGVTVVFGGVDGSGFLGDLWAWTGAEWRKLADASSAGPAPRATGQLVYDQKRDRVVLFGGRNRWPDGDLNDTWEWDGATWRRIGN